MELLTIILEAFSKCVNLHHDMFGLVSYSVYILVNIILLLNAIPLRTCEKAINFTHNLGVCNYFTYATHDVL